LIAIEAALEDMRQAETVEAWNAADVRFHIAILLAAGNELLVPLGFVIESALGNMFDYTATHNEDRRSALPLHEEILRAIRQGKPEAARTAARRLLSDTDRIIGLQERGLQERSRPDGATKSRPTPDKSKGGRRNA